VSPSPSSSVSSSSSRRLGALGVGPSREAPPCYDGTHGSSPMGDDRLGMKREILILKKVRGPSVASDPPVPPVLLLVLLLGGPHQPTAHPLPASSSQLQTTSAVADRFVGCLLH